MSSHAPTQPRCARYGGRKYSSRSLSTIAKFSPAAGAPTGFGAEQMRGTLRAGRESVEIHERRTAARLGLGAGWPVYQRRYEGDAIASRRNQLRGAGTRARAVVAPRRRRRPQPGDEIAFHARDRAQPSLPSIGTGTWAVRFRHGIRLASVARRIAIHLLKTSDAAVLDGAVQLAWACADDVEPSCPRAVDSTGVPPC